MKVISIKQPYASLIAYGYKEYEFRTWKTNYRGKIYIHASKSVDKIAMEKYKELNIDFKTGCIIACADLTDCIEINNEFRTHIKPKNKYPYVYNHILSIDKNKYAFELKNVKQLKEPFNVNGQLGIWNYDLDN